MSDHGAVKVGIVSCSGEGIPEGTVARLACRKVLDELRPGQTVTICLPLFIAGGREERNFAAKYPTITVDGCAKRCAQKSTRELSGRPAASLVVSEIVTAEQIDPPVRRRNLTRHERMVVDVIAGKIAQTVDDVLER